MLLAVALQLAALARPTAVFTEWSLIERAPRAEHVTTRADYRRRDGAVAALPRVVQRGPRPSARVAGTGAPLDVFARDGLWCVALPDGERPALRVVAEVTRAVERSRAFRMEWPRFVDEGVPARQLVLVPRAALDDGIPDGWTCPRAPAAEVPCVTRDARPAALVHSLPALPSPPWSRPLAALLAALSLGYAYAPRERRLERFAAGAGGATVGLALALSLVGASMLAWGPALCLAVPAATALGLVAGTSRIGRAAGGVALAVVPLASVAGSHHRAFVGVEAVLALVAALVAVALWGAARER